MTIEKVDILGVRADPDEMGFELGWEDDDGYFGIIEFSQDNDGGKIRVDSEHTSKEFVSEVLNALLNNIEVID